MIRAGLSILCVLALCAAPLRADHVDGVAHTKPGEKTVYMVLMAYTDMAHVVEMPSMERCRAAIEFVERAQCIEAIKPPSGDFPPQILNMIPVPDEE